MARLFSRSRPARPATAFTLVELLAVMGIIAMLLAILLPAMSGAQRSSQAVTCKANLKQTYLFLMMYAQENKGFVFPSGRGSAQPRQERWPAYVFKPAAWNPPILICPADPLPGEAHSYVLNNHCSRYDIRLHRTKGVSASQIILMGEKQSEITDYYMDAEDFDRVVEKFRHGFYLASNYLFLDGHVDNSPPESAKGNIDPWEPPVADTSVDAGLPG